MSERISAGQRVLHLSTGYYGIVLAAATTGYSLVVFDGEQRAVEVRQCELMSL